MQISCGSIANPLVQTKKTNQKTEAYIHPFWGRGDALPIFISIKRISQLQNGLLNNPEEKIATTPEIPAGKGRQRLQEKWKPWTLFSLWLPVSAADCLGDFLIFLVTFCIKATERSELANTFKKQAFMSKKVIGVWGNAPFGIVKK